MLNARQAGITLIELMVITAIAAVLLSTAIPSLGSLVQENRITGISNYLLTNLHYARHEAVFRRTYVAACPSDDLQTCSGHNRWDLGWIVFVDDSRNGQPDDPERDILRVFQADDRMLMHSAGRTRVRFQPHGGAYGTNLTIRVCERNGRARPRAVIVSNPGRIRVTRDVDPGECEV
jgi:type IV fimbrial biogenesis protein FimT